MYYETTTTMCTLCTLYVVNVEECKIFHSSTNAKYFTVYDQTTMCELCTHYIIVNVEECKIFAMQYCRQKLQRNISLNQIIDETTRFTLCTLYVVNVAECEIFHSSKPNILLCMMKLQCVHYALSML